MHSKAPVASEEKGAESAGEVLDLLGIWRGASFADPIQQTGFDELGKGAPHGHEDTRFPAHA